MGDFHPLSPPKSQKTCSFLSFLKYVKKTNYCVGALFDIYFNTTYVTFDVREREVGTSKWSKTALFKYAMSNIASFSTVPMQLVTVLGAIMLIISVIFSMISFIQKINGIGLPGFTTVIILLLFFK